MAKTIKATVSAEIKYGYKNADEVATTQEAGAVENENGYVTGDGPNELEVMWRKQVTVTAASPNYDLDLHSALSDVFGETVDFRNLRSILVKNLSETAGDDVDFGPLGVDDGFSGPWGGDGEAKNRIRAGGGLLADAPLDGHSTISGEGRNLRVTYQGTSGSIDAVILLLGLGGVLESSSSSSASSSWSSFSSSSSLSSPSSSSSSSVSVSSSSSSSSSSTSSSSSVEVSSSSLGLLSSQSSSSLALAESSGSSSSSSAESSSSSSSSYESSSSSSSPSSSSPSSSSSSGGSSLSSSSSSPSSSSLSESSSSPGTSSSSSSGPATLTVLGGTGSPANGTYDRWGISGGTTYWKLQGGNWYVARYDSETWGICNAVPPAAENLYYYLVADVYDPTGTYTATGLGGYGDHAVTA